MAHPQKLTADWVESWEKLLAQNLPFKIFLKSRELTYLTCNENYAADHGITPSEIFGRNDFDFHPPELAEKYQADDRRILETGRSETIEERYVKGGQEFHIQTIKSLFRNQSGEVIGILGTFWDVSELKRVGEALKESEAKYRSLVETTIEGVTSTDLEGNLIFVNDALCLMMGYSQDELLHKPFAGILHRDDLPVLMEMYLNAIAGARIGATVEFRAIPKTGKSIWFSTQPTAIKIDGKAIGFNAILHNVTERKRAEEDLARAEQRLSTHIDNSPLAIIEFDSEFRVIRWSKGAERIYGWTSEEITGKSISEMRWVFDDDKELVLQESASLLSGERSRSRNFNRNYRKDGSIIHCEWYNSGFYDETGRLISVFSQVLDVTDRKRTEEALRESKERLIEAQRIGKIGNWEWNPSVNKLIWSAEMYAIFGIAETANPTLEMVMQVFHPEDRAMVAEATRKTLEELKPRPIECRILKPDGSIGYVYGRGEIVLDTDGKLLKMIGIYQDITERKRVEDELRKSEARFRSYFNLPLHGIAITSPDKGWIKVNDRICSILGYTREELFRTTWTELTHPEDLAADLEQFNRVLSGQIEQYAMDKRFIRKDGEAIWTNITVGCVRKSDGCVDYIVGLMEDISERKRVEEKLRESEEKHRAVVERANDGIVILQDNIIRFSNPNFTALIGYETGEVEGMEFSRFIPEGNLGWVLERYQNRMAGEKLSRVFETALLHKRGKKIPVEVNGGLIQYEGKPADLVIMRDITERKQIEGEMDKTRADFLFGVSHELKTPLFLMNISLELLENSPESGRAKRTTEFLDTWKRNLHRLQHLVFNMVDSQRTQTMGFKLERQSVDIKALVEQVVAENELSAGPKKIRVTMDLAPIPPLWIDRDAIHRLAENLLTNAIKFSPRNGEVTVRLTQEDAEAVLTVKDQGHGISTEEQKYLFLPFQRAAAAVRAGIPGTGLGLYVAKIIVDAHGGTIALRSKVGQGTTITVRLPLGVPEDGKQTRK